MPIDETLLTLNVPTYSPDGEHDFTAPQVPVHIMESNGVLLSLGGLPRENDRQASLTIERRRNGWAVFLNAPGDDDACGYVYMLDDGRSFLVRENAWPGHPQMEIVDEPPAEIDAPQSKTLQVDVTQEDIDHGERENCSDCPVARAIARVMDCSPSQLFIAHDDSTFYPTGPKGEHVPLELPEKAQDFIDAFDAFGKNFPDEYVPVPFSFELTIR